MKLLPALVFSFAATASAAPAFAWNEHAVYTPAAGSQSGVIAIALTEWMTAFYIVFEVQDTTTATHTLYLQRWNGSTFWAAPVVLDSHVGQWSTTRRSSPAPATSRSPRTCATECAPPS